jgi:hypothetical protein
MKPRVVHVVFSVGFLALLCSAGTIQVIVEVGRGERLQALDLFRQPPTVARLRAYEQRIEDASWVAGTLRPWMQYAQFLLLRDAGDKALAGRDGWQPVPLPPMPGAETSHSTVQLLDFTRPMRVSPPDCRTNALFVPELATTATVTSQSIRNP